MNNFDTYKSLVAEAYSHLPRLSKPNVNHMTSKVLLSPDIFSRKEFDNIILSRTALITLSTASDFPSTKRIGDHFHISIPKYSHDVNYVTSLRMQTNCACRVGLWAGSDLLKEWSLSKDSQIEELCTIPLVAAEVTQFHFDVAIYSNKESPDVTITLMGLTFGHKDMDLYGGATKLVEELFRSDICVGSIPMFIMKDSMLFSTPGGLGLLADEMNEVMDDRQRFLLDPYDY
jgi:hypothetical protein